ncbi:MAG TPA: hypothetical protein VFK78_01715, partial [Gemmatimonadales bacterium]|nr:hypothetical protein [Gemmatimonadales bacterium]
MTESRRPTETRGKINALSAVLSTAACALLVFLPWSLPVPLTPSYWNAVAVFALTAILCDSWLFTSAFANLSGSIVFVPLFATVLLFGHPVPMVIASLTAWVVETLVMHKPAHRVWFNVAQFSVAIGLASVVYSALGGHVGLNDFSFKLVPFAGLVVTYFLVNQGSVALAVALSSGI